MGSADDIRRLSAGLRRALPVQPAAPGPARFPRVAAGMAFAALLLFAAAPATGQIQLPYLVGNASQAHDSFNSFGDTEGRGGEKLGLRFETGGHANGYNLSAVVLEVGTVAGVWNVSLWHTRNTSEHASPSEKLADLSNPAILIGGGNRTFTAPANTALAPNEAYMIVVAATERSTVSMTASDSEDPLSAAGFSIADFGNTITRSGVLVEPLKMMRISIWGAPRTVPLNTLVSSAESGQPANGAPASRHTHAQAFTTGSAANGYTLSDIEVGIGALGSSPGNFIATVHTAADGPPNSNIVLYRLTAPNSLTANSIARFAAPPSAALMPNSRYAVVFSRTPGGSTIHLQTTMSDAGEDPTGEGWTIVAVRSRRMDGATLWEALDERLRIRVKGQARAAAPSAPAKPTVTGAPGDAPGEAVVRWQLGNNGGARVYGVRVRWVEEGARNNLIGAVNLNTPLSLMHTITGLDPAKRYEAQVRADNLAGATWSDWSAPFSPSVDVALSVAAADSATSVAENGGINFTVAPSIAPNKQFTVAWEIIAAGGSPIQMDPSSGGSGGNWPDLKSHTDPNEGGGAGIGKGGTLTFPAGSTDPQTIRIEPFDDRLYEGDETFTISLTTSSSFVTLPVAADIPVITITDNDESVDYDLDDDNLIDIDSIPKLNAVRWDLNGDGTPTAANTSDYNIDFPNPAASMGCPGTCAGYELTTDLDFDTNGDNTINENDIYWNRGEGWLPIGSAESGNRFGATFDGKGHTISNLTINRPSTDYVGLFGADTTGAVITRLGLLKVNITGNDFVGGIAGDISDTSAVSRVLKSFVTGTITGSEFAGGIAGSLGTGIANWTNVTVRCDRFCGGIAATGNDITASYASGNVSGTDSGGLYGGDSASSQTKNVTASYARITGAENGLAAAAGTITNSYFDSELHGSENGSEAKTTAELQAPTGYTGIYQNWNIDTNLDANTDPDDLWRFGASTEYPVLKVDFDDDGSASWDEFGTQMTMTDNDAPTLSAAAANGTALTLVYNEPLDTGSVPASSAFTVSVDGTAAPLAGANPAAIADSTVTLTLAAAVTAGQTVTASYAAPTGTGASPIRDLAGNEAASIANEEVMNNTPPPPDFTGSTVLVSNFDQGQVGNNLLILGQDSGWQYGYSQAFVTGDDADGYTLTSITIGMPELGSAGAAITVEVFAVDSSNRPTGAALYTLKQPALMAGRNTFTAPPGATLGANTTYAVMVDGPSTDGYSTDGYRLGYTNSNGEDSNAASGWSIGDGVYSFIDGNSFSESYSLRLSIRGALPPTDPTLAVSETSITVAEAREATYAVELNSQPTGDVTVTPASNDPAVATVAPATLAFTASNWNTPQTVTVTGVDDGMVNANDRTATIGHDAAGGGYNLALAHQVTVTVTDGASGVGIEGAEAGELPTDVALFQNYPNPFNPRTTIEYALPQAGAVRLVVYDMLGREAAVLHDGPKPAGRHVARFDADRLPNGAYLYRLTAGGKTLTRTMALAK